MPPSGSIRGCIMVYGLLLALVSLGLLLSLSNSDNPDSVVIINSRTPESLLPTIAPTEDERDTDFIYSNLDKPQTKDTYINSSTETVTDIVTDTLTVREETTSPGGFSPPVSVVSLSPFQFERPHSGKDWSKGFCSGFIGNTYSVKSDVCPRITCRGSTYSKSTGVCMVNGVAVRPQHMYNALRQINIKKMKSSHDVMMQSNAAWLLRDQGYRSCNTPSFGTIEEFLEPLDYVRSFIKMVSLTNQNRRCTKWIPGTTFFYIGIENHIYFKFLSWYNLHRTILSVYSERKLTNYTVMRLPEGNNSFLFPEFERAIFPNVQHLQDYSKDDVLCFEDLVMVPWAYGAPPFRCRIERATLKRKCLECDGRGVETDYKSFRRRVLAACGIDETEPLGMNKKKMLVVERKQYNRRIGDKAKSFTRVWENSEDLIGRLQLKYPQYNVTGIYAERLTVCQQIRHAYESDVFIGMHGAGMVHLWWTREGAKIIELIPRSQRGNVAFKTLSRLLGRAYKEVTKVTEKQNVVNVNVEEVVRAIQPLL